MIPATEQFLAAIRAAGIQPPDVIEADGKLRRFSSNGKRGDDAGWYVLHDNGIPAGAFGCWRSGISETWCAEIGRKLTPSEDAAQRARVEAMRRAREAEEAQRQAEAKQKAAAIWKSAQPATDDYPYLAAKGVKAYGLRVHEEKLVIPMRDGAELHSLQFIAPDGEKLFLTGGRTKGCYFSIGRADKVLSVAEGYATAASVHEATGYAVAIAFSAGNLEPVARVLRAKFPQVRIVIAGDNDESGTGQKAAREAAKAIGGLIAIPAEAGKDWNDIHREHGVEAVRSAIEGARPVVADPAGLPLESVGVLLSAPPVKRDWLIEDVFVAGSISVLAARPKAGKSTFSRDLAVCVARGKPFLERNTKQGPVILLDLEGKREELTESFRGLGVEVNDEIHILCGIAPQDAIALLRRDAMRLKPSLIVVDTLQRLARVRDLNDYASTTIALEPFISIARDSGAHVMLLHHSGRADGHGVDAPMGSTAISGSVDTIAVLKRKEDGARTLATVQRYGKDLEPSLLTMDKDGHVHLGGTVLEAETKAAEARVEEFVRANPKTTQQDIKEGVEGRWSIVRGAITAMVKDKRLVREGEGKKGEPHLYSVPGNTENASNAGSGGSLHIAGTRIPAFPALECPPNAGGNGGKPEPAHNEGPEGEAL